MSMPAVFHPLRVRHTEPLCADALAVTFAVPEGLRDTYAHRAGQYLTLRHLHDGVEERRSYSICSAVGEDLRIGIRRVPGGLFSDRILSDLRPGDVVESLPPQGAFTPEPATYGAHHGFVAAGSGITPILAIISTLLASDPSARASLIFGNRDSRSVMFADEIADLKDLHPGRLHVVHVLSREVSAVELLSGRLDAPRLEALLEQVVSTGDIGHWWLCGPLGLVTEAAKALGRYGVARDRIHSELFYTGVAPPPMPARGEELPANSTRATLVLGGQSSTLGIPPGGSILDGALRTRTDLPFACRSGVCGTCRAKLTEGSVEQLWNFALGRPDIADGFILTCQSVPTSDRVTVDFDA